MVMIYIWCFHTVAILDSLKTALADMQMITCEGLRMTFGESVLLNLESGDPNLNLNLGKFVWTTSPAFSFFLFIILLLSYIYWFHIAQAGVKLPVLLRLTIEFWILTLLSECWNYRHVQPCLECLMLLVKDILNLFCYDFMVKWLDIYIHMKCYEKQS